MEVQERPSESDLRHGYEKREPLACGSKRHGDDMTTGTFAGEEKKNGFFEKKSTELMRALVFSGPNRIAIERVPIPKAGYGEVVMRVTLTTICGTDVHI